MLPAVLLVLALSLCLDTAHSAIYRISPQSHSPQPSPSYPPAHLVFPLDAHHSLTSLPTSSSFHPLSIPSSRPSRSRFSLMQTLPTDSNLTGCAAIDFSGLVSINSQGPFRLIIDSGSTTLAVVSSACTTCQSAHPTFTPDPSSLGNGGESITASYGGGTSWTGHVYRASVALGASQGVGTEIGVIEENNGFINGANVCAVNADAKIGLNSSQGIMGFAYPSNALSGTDSWVANYVAATGVSNEFTIQMCPVGGNVWVGGYDGNFVNGAFQYVPIVKPAYYSVMLTDISVVNSQGASTSTGYTQSTFGPCVSEQETDCTILDSGTTFILLPSAAYTKLVSLIRADPYYQSVFDTVPGIPDPLQQTKTCAPASMLPSLSTLQAKLPQLVFTLANADGSAGQTFTTNSIPGYLSLNYDESNATYYCTGLGMSSGAAILGYAFMNQFTVRHDLANQRVGFAPTANCGVAAPQLPSYHWVTGDWGACSATCGVGVQWRQVNCTDQWGTKHADLACAAIYLSNSPRPIDSQQCNTSPCNVAAPTFTSVQASSTTLVPGSTYSISFQYTASSDPDYLTLFLAPTPSSSSSLPSYIARNATGVNGAGSYSFKVPSAAWIPAGSYYLGAYAGTYQNDAVYTSTSTVTIASCSSGTCGAQVCTPSTCSGNGECDVVAGAAVCTCVPGWSGATCSTSANNGALWCSDNGVVDASGSYCLCSPSFTGPQCEQPYANLTVQLTIQQGAALANQAVLTRSVILDLAYAAGVYPHQITVQSITATPSASTLIAFSIQAQSSAADLVARVQALTSLSLSSVILASGLATGQMSGFEVLSLPPVGGGGGGAEAWASQWGPYIGGGVGGFIVVFLLLYCIAGGRFHECRGQRLKKEKRAQYGPRVGDAA